MNNFTILAIISFCIISVSGYNQSTQCDILSADCDIENINGNTFQLPNYDSYQGNQDFPFCNGSGNVDNAIYFPFIAGAIDFDIEIEVLPNSCSAASNPPCNDVGIQASVWLYCESQECIGGDVTCIEDGGFATISLSNMDIGEFYVLTIDGCCGSSCAFSISFDAPSWETEAPGIDEIVLNTYGPDLCIPPFEQEAYCPGAEFDISADDADGGFELVFVRAEWVWSIDVISGPGTPDDVYWESKNLSGFGNPIEYGDTANGIPGDNNLHLIFGEVGVYNICLEEINTFCTPWAGGQICQEIIIDEPLVQDFGSFTVCEYPLSELTELFYPPAITNANGTFEWNNGAGISHDDILASNGQLEAILGAPYCCEIQQNIEIELIPNGTTEDVELTLYECQLPYEWQGLDIEDFEEYHEFEYLIEGGFGERGLNPDVEEFCDWPVFITLSEIIVEDSLNIIGCDSLGLRVIPHLYYENEVDSLPLEDREAVWLDSLSRDTVSLDWSASIEFGKTYVFQYTGWLDDLNTGNNFYCIDSLYISLPDTLSADFIEVCDGIDNDCDGLIDEGFQAPDDVDITCLNVTSNSVSFEWNEDPLVADYDVHVNGVPIGNQIENYFEITNLAPNEETIICVTANSFDGCYVLTECLECQTLPIVNSVNYNCTEQLPVCNPSALQDTTFKLPDYETYDGERGLFVCSDGTVDNAIWYAFVAGNTDVNITIENLENSCSLPSSPPCGQLGIQAAVWEGCPQSNGHCIAGNSDCIEEGTIVNFNISDLIIGATYYVLLDGCCGSTCDINVSIDVSAWDNNIPDAQDVQLITEDSRSCDNVFNEGIYCLGQEVTVTALGNNGIHDLNDVGGRWAWSIASLSGPGDASDVSWDAIAESGIGNPVIYGNETDLSFEGGNVVSFTFNELGVYNICLESINTYCDPWNSASVCQEITITNIEDQYFGSFDICSYRHQVLEETFTPPTFIDATGQAWEWANGLEGITFEDVNNGVVEVIIGDPSCCQIIQKADINYVGVADPVDVELSLYSCQIPYQWEDLLIVNFSNNGTNYVIDNGSAEQGYNLSNIEACDSIVNLFVNEIVLGDSLSIVSCDGSGVSVVAHIFTVDPLENFDLRNPSVAWINSTSRDTISNTWDAIVQGGQTYTFEYSGSIEDRNTGNLQVCKDSIIFEIPLDIGVEEICDGIDNDCDGLVDEEFDIPDDIIISCNSVSNNSIEFGWNEDVLIQEYIISIDGMQILQQLENDFLVTGLSPGQTIELCVTGYSFSGCNTLETCILCTTDLNADNDMDGYDASEDCDDNNPDINPGATEIPGNGIDEDCDGLDGPLDVIELDNISLNIYPNPAYDIIHIQKDGHLDMNVSLFDINGKLLRTLNNPDNINLEDLSQGQYFLRLVSQKTGQYAFERIIVIK